MPKPMYVWSGSAWVSVASEVESLANYATQSYADNSSNVASGLKLIVPSSVAIGSGSSSVSTLGQVTFTSASSVSLNNVFSSTYDNYRVIVNVTSTSTNFDPLHFRLRVSGTDNSSNNYKFHLRYFNYGGSGGDSTSSAYSSFPIGSVDSGSTGTGLRASFDVIAPFQSVNTSYGTLHTQYNYGFYGTGITTVTTSYDGCSLVPASGTITGTISVYGYKD